MGSGWNDLLLTDSVLAVVLVLGVVPITEFLLAAEAGTSPEYNAGSVTVSPGCSSDEFFLSVSHRCEFKQFQPPISSREQSLALLKQCLLWLWQQLHHQSRHRISCKHWFEHGSLSQNFPEPVVTLQPTNHLRLPNPSDGLRLDWVLPLLLQGQHCDVWVEIAQKKTHAVPAKQNVSIQMCKSGFCGIDDLRNVFLFFFIRRTFDKYSSCAFSVVDNAVILDLH